MTTWNLKNPHSLPMIIKLQSDGSVLAEFPALSGCRGVGVDTDIWKARDKAIFNCAQSMVASFGGAA